MKSATHMNKSTGLTAFVLGGLVGGAIALLYAPQSGRKTREFLMTEGQETADKVMKSIREAQDHVLKTIDDAQVRLEAMSEETKTRLTRLQEIARGTLDEQKGSLRKGYSDARDVINE